MPALASPAVGDSTAANPDPRSVPRISWKERGVFRVLGIAAVLLVFSGALGAIAATTSDQTAPGLTLSAPTGGGTVSGTVTVSATASDDVGVASVQFKVDGAAFGASQTVPPYAAAWNTTSLANGNHTVSAVATDGSGNTATVNAVVDVENAPPPPPPPPPPTGQVTTTVVAQGSDTDRITHTFTIPVSVAAGTRLLLAHVSTVDATDGTGGIVAPNGVSDTAGDVWRQDGVSHHGTAFETDEIWSTTPTSTLPAGTVVTVVGYSRGLSDEYAFIAVTGVGQVDKTASSEAYGTSQTTPAVPTSQAHELLVGVVGQSSASSPWWTPAGGWSELVDRFDAGNIGRGLVVQVREVTATGSYASSGKAKQAVTANNLIVTYAAG
jgi:hypothetical protein